MQTNLDASEEKKVLIVEDEAALANALKLKLQAVGVDAEIVSDGADALSRLENETFDLIILDLVMPKVDGFNVLESMKEQGIEIPVIVASNLSQVDDQNKVKALGAKDYFVKSNVSLNNLVEKIQNYI